VVSNEDQIWPAGQEWSERPLELARKRGVSMIYTIRTVTFPLRSRNQVGANASHPPRTLLLEFRFHSGVLPVIMSRR